MSTTCLHGGGGRYAPDSCISTPQQLICPSLNPFCHLGLSGSAVGRVVFKAAIAWRVMRGRNNYSIRKMLLAAPVIHKDRARDDGCRRYAIIFLNNGLYVIAGQHFQRSALCRRGDRMRVLPHVKRAICLLLSPVVTDGL